MKIIIPGGTGQVGGILRRHWEAAGHEVWLLSRSRRSEKERVLNWDGKTLTGWEKSFDGADVIINLAGRSVNCRYSERNLREMMDSRIDSTLVVGEAIQKAAHPPRLWLQMSTATIYSHRFDAPNDELSGEFGGTEPAVPAYWKRSIEIATAWEEALNQFDLPDTRRVALRSAMVMSPDDGGVFSVLANMTRWRLGGPIGGGRQYVSWIHEYDFTRSLDFLIENQTLAGPINITSPNPLPQKQFMRELRAACGISIGLPATQLMAEIGAFVLRSDTELLLKSRRVVPTRLLQSGFEFSLPTWSSAVEELVARQHAWRRHRGKT